MIVALFILAFACLDVAWWAMADRILRPVRRALLWRSVLGITMGGVILYALWMVTQRFSATRAHWWLPTVVPAAFYLWHILVLPMALLATIAGKAAARAADVIRSLRAPPPPRRGVLGIPQNVAATTSSPPPPVVSPPAPSVAYADRPAPPPRRGPSRRQVLAAGALAIPPLATASLAGASLFQLGRFRINRVHLEVPGMPWSLNGLTLALVADVHAGMFTTRRMLDDIAAATNDLRADAILLGGDLINISLADLPNALDMVKRLDAPLGVYMIQGNHDCIDNAAAFNQRSLAAGVRLLLDEVQPLSFRGTPFELLGTCWKGEGRGIEQSVAAVAAQATRGAFPILLAHHPHAWDPAAARNIPLVLSGHTHGGQIMLTDHVGGGPIRFRYWSGLYARPGSSLFVSNGVGNWFPLRVNAPAEIVHLTLHPKRA